VLGDEMLTFDDAATWGGGVEERSPRCQTILFAADVAV
jgi:hypothetical protein